MKGLPPALKAVLNKEKKHKYGAIRSTCLYGHNHDSRKEADWCLKLNELQKEGKIIKLTRERKFPLAVNGVHICDYLPDFYFYKPNSSSIPLDVGLDAHVVEVKGMQTPEWKLKHKLFLALYPHIKAEVV